MGAQLGLERQRPEGLANCYRVSRSELDDDAVAGADLALLEHAADRHRAGPRA